MSQSQRSQALRVISALVPLACIASGSMPNGANAQSAADASTWIVSSVPQTVFGDIEGDLDGGFVRVVDVARGMDGSLAVADRQLSTISVFSPDGDLVATVGRQGEGPREFSGIATLVAGPEGRLLVFDERLQRITELTFDGTFAGTTRLTRGASDRQIGGVGRFEDGSWYAWERTQVIASGVGETAQDTVAYYQLADSEVGEQLVRVRATISTQFKLFGDQGIRYALLTPRPLGAARGKCLFVGTSDTPVLRVVDRTGADRGEVRLEARADRTTREHRREWAATTIDERGDQGGFLYRFMIRRMASRISMAEWVPFVNKLVMDDLGYIWAQRYQFPDGFGSPQWQVFTETGTGIGTVTLPVALDVMEISAGAILGVHTDDLGRQEVRAYSLDRGVEVEGLPLPPGCRSDRSQ